MGPVCIKSVSPKPQSSKTWFGLVCQYVFGTDCGSNASVAVSWKFNDMIITGYNLFWPIVLLIANKSGLILNQNLFIVS